MDKIIHTKDNSDLDLYIDKDDRYIIFIDSEVLKIRYHIKKAKAKIIYIILEELDIDLIEDGKIEDSEVTIAFIDVSKSVLKAQSRIEVKDHASLSLISKYLVSTDKDIDILCTNASKNTAVAIDNSAVALDDARLRLTCTGKIINGAKASISHQKSRTLVSGKVKDVKIDPILLIEESDVEASHAMSSGTIDEEVLYYMKSRGIKEEEAMRLLVTSYLLPDEGLFEGHEDKDAIINLIQERMEENVR